LARTGVDLAIHRDGEKVAQAYRAANTFEAFAREWLDRQKAEWVNGHHSKILARFENDIFPYIGSREAALIMAPDLLSVIRRKVSPMP